MICYKSKLHHIGMGRALNGTRVILLVAGRNIRVLSEDGELLRHLTLDPNRDYQPRGTAYFHHASRHLSTMPRDITTVPGGVAQKGRRAPPRSVTLEAAHPL